MSSQLLTNTLLIFVVLIQTSQLGATNRILQLSLHLKGLPQNWRRTL